MSSSKVIINVCLQLNISVVGLLGPLGMLSGPVYRIKLLALVVLEAPMCTDFTAKTLIRACFQLNISVVGHPSPLGLLSGPMYRIKLLAMVVL